METEKKPTAMLFIGMAGTGKTTLLQRINAYLSQQKKTRYVINLDPAVHHLPYKAHIDIRDTVNYREVMKQYKLGPNGGILTSLNLFTTKFDQVLQLIERKEEKIKYLLVDTPGQIELFTWSASGAIIAESLSVAYPSVVLYIIDTPRSTSPTTFMSNMLYAVSILYKTKLPFVLVFNKTDVVSHDFCVEWMQDFEVFQQAIEEDSYMSTLMHSMSMVLEEFYESLRVVGVSAATGEGMDELFEAIDESVKEYHEEYKPHLEKQAQEKKEREAAKQKEQLQKLMKDLSVENPQ
jgi:GTPase SAR1 family protein